MKGITNKHLDELKNLGLSKTQTILYLSSLEHGVLSVLELSKITKINRQQIYDDAAKLIEIGLYETTRKQGKRYIAAEPSKLLRIAEERIVRLQDTLSELHGIIPALEELVKPTKNKVKVKYYEGLEKIKAAYETELDAATNTEVLSLAGSIDNIFDFFPERYWEKWNKKFALSKSSTRMLVHNSDRAKNHSLQDKKYKRETRYLHNFPLKVNIDIFNNSVLIVSFSDKIALWIDSEVLSQSYRIMFNTLWSQAKSYEMS
jgi:sugar-specific transcriptional regulator TrmB